MMTKRFWYLNKVFFVCSKRSFTSFTINVTDVLFMFRLASPKWLMFTLTTGNKAVLLRVKGGGVFKVFI